MLVFVRVFGQVFLEAGFGTLPFLIRDFHVAMTVAISVVLIELAGISFIRWRYMDTPFLNAAFQVVVGGLLVFLVGWYVGAS